MGFTFKENCPDLRNTKVIDLINGFKKRSCNVDVYDRWADKEQSVQEFGIIPIIEPIKNKYDAIVIAVAHNDFVSLTAEQRNAFGKDKHVIYDIKYLFKSDQTDGRL